METTAPAELGPDEPWLRAVRLRVRARFAGEVPVEVVDRVLDEYTARWAAAPVKTYLSVLVERFSTEELRRLGPDRTAA